MQMGQKQRDCQVASQPEHRKSSIKSDKVAWICQENMLKRARGREQWLRQESIQT
jgi:hypothetical protein